MHNVAQQESQQKTKIKQIPEFAIIKTNFDSVLPQVKKHSEVSQVTYAWY